MEVHPLAVAADELVVAADVVVWVDVVVWAVVVLEVDAAVVVVEDEVEVSIAAAPY
jgi:hypothetical protein